MIRMEEQKKETKARQGGKEAKAARRKVRIERST